MKKSVLLGLALMVAIAGAAKNDKKSKDNNKSQQTELIPTTEEQRIAYAMGTTMGSQMVQMQEQTGVVLDSVFFYKGLNEAMHNNAKMTDEEIQKTLQGLDERVKAKQAEKNNAAKAAGIKFLTENSKQPGVVVTPSGLQYKVVKEGNGQRPTTNSTVTVHYEGKLIDGKVFDSSVQRGEPITFKANQVIKGWQEGILLMSKGAKYILYIPSELGYGDNGAGNVIPGGATLIFEVELIDFSD